MIDIYGFQECGICASKTGTFSLCGSCLNNRDRISALHGLLVEIARAIAHGERKEDHRGVTYTQTFGKGFVDKIVKAT